MDTFTYTIEGKKISLPFAKVRAICPHEVAVMERAEAQISIAVASGHQQAIDNATKQLTRAELAVIHALQRAGRGTSGRADT